MFVKIADNVLGLCDVEQSKHKSSIAGLPLKFAASPRCCKNLITRGFGFCHYSSSFSSFAKSLTYSLCDDLTG